MAGRLLRKKIHPALHPYPSLGRIGLMPKPNRRKRPAAEMPLSTENPIDLETQRRLRRDLKLTSEDIAEIDLELAIEAGLLKKPKRR